MQVLLLALTLGFAVASAGYMVYVGTHGSPDGDPIPTEDESRRHVMWGMFYVNPADPRGWLRKPTGVGYTVNFRTVANVRVFVALIVCALVSASALVLNVGCA